MPDLQTILLICAVLLWAGAQYGMMIWAVRDLLLRPRVPGGNKVVWALVILTLPIAGALLYAMATPRPPVGRPARLVVSRRRLATHDDPAA